VDALLLVLLSPSSCLGGEKSGLEPTINDPIRGWIVVANRKLKFLV
jgi:hypothetical protein